MGDASFILAINLSVAGMLAAAFLAVSVYGRTIEAGRWFALAFAGGMANYLLEFALPFSGGSPAVGLAAYLAVAASLTAFNIGLCRHYAVEPPWRVTWALLVYAVIAGYLVLDMQRGSLARNLLYQSSYAGVQAVSFWIVWRARHRGTLDNVLAALLALGTLHFLWKPLVALAAGGPGASAATYVNSTYALISQSVSAILAIGVALMMLVILMRDALSRITRQSQTDPLSGLLNRGGFEGHLMTIVSEATAKGMPVALVLCDLDRFKDINDTHGHATGDRVIAAFGARLRSGSDDRFVIGRIGGEEFAVALPGVNLPAARLFAETVRTGFSGLPIEGLPETLRFTASFGVTELYPGELASEALERADQALYCAKKAGRDCVRAIAPMPKEIYRRAATSGSVSSR